MTTTPATGGRTAPTIVKTVTAAPVAVVKKVAATTGRKVSGIGSGVSGTIQKVAGTLGGGAAQARAGVGSTVGTVTGTVGGTVSKVGSGL